MPRRHSGHHCILDVGVRRTLLCTHPRACAPTHVHAHTRRGKTAPFCPFTARAELAGVPPTVSRGAPRTHTRSPPFSFVLVPPSLRAHPHAPREREPPPALDPHRAWGQNRRATPPAKASNSPCRCSPSRPSFSSPSEPVGYRRPHRGARCPGAVEPRRRRHHPETPLLWGNSPSTWR
jgi:hypothetical protein